MWIICAGGKRSGSTLQYNIVSRVVEESKMGIRITHFRPEEFKKIKENNSGKNELKVIKLHRLSNEILKEINRKNTIIFHCFRDIRDVIVSYINKDWIKKENTSIRNSVNNYLNEYNSWQGLDVEIHSRKYEDFTNDLTGEIQYISNVLKAKLSSQTINLIKEELSLEKLKKNQDNITLDKQRESYGQIFHKDTLIHKNHIFDGSSNQFLKCLTREQIVSIESISYKYLFSNNYKLCWAKFDEFLSFSQHADDYIAWQLLGKRNQGLIIEVGAFDGVHLSNSFALEQLGWDSICIEPNPSIFKFLERNRPSSLNINKAIVGDNSISEIEFYAEEIGVLSGCNYDEEDVRKRYKNRGLKYSSPKKIHVPATTLNSILESAVKPNTIIDLISIDVEGFEIEVLKGVSLDKYKVNLFIIEANTDSEALAILKYFEKYPEYVFLGSNSQNLFIARKSSMRRNNLKNLEFKNYTKATQIHPVDPKLVLDSVPPNFKKSPNYFKMQKFLKLF